MRIVIIEREEGRYSDGEKKYDLVEVPSVSNVSTLKPIVEAVSADVYAMAQGWEKLEENN